MERRCSVDELHHFIVGLLEAVGIGKTSADITAQVLVSADCEGNESHGVLRLPIYIENLEKGRFNRNPMVTAARTGSGTAVVDGDNGLGQWVAYRAMETAIDIARESGVGTVSVRESNHFGVASYYGEMACKECMIGLVLSNTPAAMAPWGGRTPFFGTNPIAIVVPTSINPIVIDMSTSVVARGKILYAAQHEQRIPHGWAVDKYGAPTDDPNAALKGTLLPIAEGKGYALALGVEVLAGVLSGSAWGPDVGWMYDEHTTPVNMGHFMMAIQVSRFLKWEKFLERIDEFMAAIKSVPLAANVSSILIPGERRAVTRLERKLHGIPVPVAIINQLNQLASKYKVQPL